MKKIALAVILGGLSLTGTMQAQAEDNPLNFQFTGRVETAATSCAVLLDKYVMQLQHDNRTLPVQGQRLNSVYATDELTISLAGDDCNQDEGYLHIGIKFVGTPDSSLGNVMANMDTSPNGAKDVGVQINNMISDVIIPNTTQHFPAAAFSGGKPTDQPASMPVSFHLVSLVGGTATAGNVQTDLTLQIDRM